jgi:hypothetical protein
MKKILLCFFILQIASCHFGTIEPKPETTKLSIPNNSGVQLLNVTWNGTVFGDISPGGRSERDVSNGSGYVFFHAGNNKQYRTYIPLMIEKYKHEESPFVDGTLILETSNSNSNPFSLSKLNEN